MNHRDLVNDAIRTELKQLLLLLLKHIDNGATEQ